MQRWLGPADALLPQAAGWCAVLCAAHGVPRAATLAGAAVVAAQWCLGVPLLARVARVQTAEVPGRVGGPSRGVDAGERRWAR